MKAVLLAAGLGTRLRPLTDTTRSASWPSGNARCWTSGSTRWTTSGVDEVLVNTHHLADQVVAHVARRLGGPPVRLVHEETSAAAQERFGPRRPLLEADPWFLAVNSDNLTDYDLTDLVAAHAGGSAMATLTRFHAPRPSQCGILEVDEPGRLVGFEEKPALPRSDLANAGLYAFSRDVLDLIEGPEPRDIGTHLLPRLVGRARVLEIGNAYLRDIGTPEALAEARATWREGAHR